MRQGSCQKQMRLCQLLVESVVKSKETWVVPSSVVTVMYNWILYYHGVVLHVHAKNRGCVLMTCNILGEAAKVESGARGWNSVLKMIGCHRHDRQWGHCRCWTYVSAGHACLVFPIMAL